MPLLEVIKRLRTAEAAVLSVVIVGDNSVRCQWSLRIGVMTVAPPHTALTVLIPSIEMPLVSYCPPLALA